MHRGYIVAEQQLDDDAVADRLIERWVSIGDAFAGDRREREQSGSRQSDHQH